MIWPIVDPPAPSKCHTCTGLCQHLTTYIITFLLRRFIFQRTAKTGVLSCFSWYLCDNTDTVLISPTVMGMIHRYNKELHNCFCSACLHSFNTYVPHFLNVKPQQRGKWPLRAVIKNKVKDTVSVYFLSCCSYFLFWFNVVFVVLRKGNSVRVFESTMF